MPEDTVDDRASVASSEGEGEQVRSPGTRSVNSWRSGRSLGRSRTQSRPRSPEFHLHRIYSAGFHDDHGTYLHPEDPHLGVDAEATLGTDLSPSTSDENDREKESEEEREKRESQDFDHESTAEDPIDRAGTNANLEKADPSLRRQPTSKSTRSQKDRDPNMVSWNGPDDPENPRNWTKKRKWLAVVVVSSFTFISPVASSMVAPSLPEMAKDLHANGSVESQMMLSIFLLAYAFGPLFLGPLSEVYGRIPVLQLANLFFLIFNLVCGFAQNTAQMLVFRFLSGLGGSAPLAIGGGIIADCFVPEQRSTAIAIYSLAPMVGPAIGPIAGGFITENTTWRWVFWAVTIADAVVQLSGIFFLQETWAPKLLERKATKLRKETGNDNLYAEMTSKQSVIRKLEHSLVRPFRLLFTQPIIIALSLYMAYIYGLVYLLISSFAALFTSPRYYNESIGIAGLNYLALAIGYFLGSQISARFNNWLYRRLKKKNNGVGKPEFRIPVMLPCTVLLPIGLFWFGWSAEARVHWIMPDIGATLAAGAMICGYQAIQTYVIDSYTMYAASAVAAITCLRSIAGFGFPLFAPAMYDALGYGWGNSVLAFAAIAIGVPAPWFFWHYGETLRNKSKYAAGGN